MNWYTADTHYGHRNVIHLCERPFTNLNHMHETMVERWNAVVDDDDVVFHLGDLALGFEFAREYVPRLKGHKILVMGNHDKCHPVHFSAPRFAAYLRAIEKYGDLGFQLVQVEMHSIIDEKVVRLHHMPYRGDHTHVVRYQQWRPIDGGEWLIHGHVHTAWKKRGRMINVGVDMWDFTPVSELQLKELMRDELSNIAWRQDPNQGMDR